MEGHRERERERERQRQRNGEVMRRIFARLQSESSKNSQLNSGDDAIKDSGAIQVLIGWRSQSF